MKKYSEEEWAGITRLLLACGCPVQSEHNLRISPVGISVRQLPNVGVNMVFDLDDGRSGWVMEMRLINESSRPIRSGGVQITAPWGGVGISLLPDPAKSNREYESYDFPGAGSLGFHRTDVLNEFLSGNVHLNPRAGISGLLLAIDEDPIPSNLPEHGRTEVVLTVFDEKGNPFSARFKLNVDRGATVARERRIKTAAESRSKSRVGRVRDAA